jgi:hypothetical protein
MKKVFCLFYLGVILFGCAKPGFSEYDNFSGLTKEMLSKTDFASLNQAYQFLSLNEEAALWDTKFNAILKNDEGKLTAEQYNDVKFIYDFIKSTGYNKIKSDPAIGEAFVDENIARFESHFTKVQLYMLIQCPYYEENFSLTLANQYAEKLAFYVIPGDDGPVSNCECRYDISCPGWNNDCEEGKGNCTQVAECGLLGHSRCKGRCSLSPA